MLINSIWQEKHISFKEKYFFTAECAAILILWLMLGAMLVIYYPFLGNKSDVLYSIGVLLFGLATILITVFHIGYRPVMEGLRHLVRIPNHPMFSAPVWYYKHATFFRGALGFPYTS